MKHLIIFLGFIMPAISFSKASPPQAEKIPHQLMKHNDIRTDFYYWLKDVKNPKVKKHLQAENKYFRSYFSTADKKLIKTIVNEIKGKIEEDSVSAPTLFGDYEYFSQTQKGKNYSKFLRRKVGVKKSEEETVLDENAKAKGKSYFATRSKEFSPDLTKLAWCFDYDGSGRCEIEIQDLKTLKSKKIGVEGVVWGDIAWAPDSQSLFYTLPDKAWRPSEIWVTDLKGNKKKVLSEPDELFNMSIEPTSDGKHVFASSESFNDSKIWHWNGDVFELVIPLKPNVIVHLDHSDKGFFAFSNHRHKNYGIYRLHDFKDPQENWEEIVAPDPQAKIKSMEPIGGVVLYSLGVAGVSEIKILNLESKKMSPVAFPDVVYAASTFLTGHPLHARVSYSSPVSPEKVFQLETDSAELKLLKANKSPTLKPELYETELKFVKARDGEQIPIHIVYRKDKRKKGPQPLRLYGYGSYGFTIPSYFDAKVFSLLDRGFIHVSAHVRGSDAKGESWYDDGKMMNKKNTFNDFVDVAKYLIDQKITSREMLAIHGGSAGGLLVGASMNQAPELFRAVIAEVPFVDVLTTMSDPTIPLTTQEYIQWGNPDDKTAYDYMKSYSPYDNVQKVKYPAVFVQTGINDQQVAYWEPTKWVLKLRENTQSKNPIIMTVNMGAGHGGKSGRYNAFEETAEKYVFLIKELKH